MGLWSRRRVLTAAGQGLSTAVLINTFGSSVWATERVGACTLTPELTIGPYYYPYELIRENIREDRQGVPLRFELELRHAVTCAPVADAAVDIWHCDALGLYSAFTKATLGPPPDDPNGHPPHDPTARPRRDMGPNGRPPGGPGGPEGPSGPPQMKPTDDQTFLRGVQLTDARGRVQFETIYPGWYQGRDTHIHLEVHVTGHSMPAASHAHDAAHTTLAKYAGGHVCHVGQIAFEDELSDSIAKLKPYSEHDLRRTRLQEDRVFLGEPRDYLMEIKRRDPSNLQAGLTGTITVFVNPDTTPAPVGMGEPGAPRREGR